MIEWNGLIYFLYPHVYHSYLWDGKDFGASASTSTILGNSLKYDLAFYFQPTSGSFKDPLLYMK